MSRKERRRVHIGDDKGKRPDFGNPSAQPKRNFTEEQNNFFEELKKKFFEENNRKPDLSERMDLMDIAKKTKSSVNISSSDVESKRA